MQCWKCLQNDEQFTMNAARVERKLFLNYGKTIILNFKKYVYKLWRIIEIYFSMQNWSTEMEESGIRFDFR